MMIRTISTFFKCSSRCAPQLVNYNLAGSCCKCPHNPLRTISITAILHKKNKVPRKPLIYLKNKREIVKIWRNMTVQELADVLNKTVEETFYVLSLVENSHPYNKPSSVIHNLAVTQEAVRLSDKRFVVESPQIILEEKENKDACRQPPPLESDLVPRPPVVTIMGHVDHGKTTLLDALRHSSIVDSEFGGITQHIGAFSVTLSSGESVTFLDTPGHAAFSAMRARGAHATDLIVLVVAAEDGVMEQTKECIALSKETKVPIIVAINKIDKPGANVPACKEKLLQAGVQLEEQGGDVQAIEISALKGINISLLVESLVAQAEVLDLRADPKGLVEAMVIEAKQEPGRGKVATCLVSRGTLRKGAYLVAGKAWAKVRNMFDDSGKTIDSAAPGCATQVIGWRELPSAGDEVLQVESERRAKEVVLWREEATRAQKDSKDYEAIQHKMQEHLSEYRAQLEERRQRGLKRRPWRGRPPHPKLIKFDPRPRLCMVLKGDVDGSIEAILDVLDTYHSEECPIEILSYGVGSVTEADVKMATNFKGIIYAFNTTVPRKIQQFAQEEGVSIHSFNIIYRLIEKLKDDISDRLPPKPVEVVKGEAVVQEEFIVKENKLRLPVAGCRCTKGILKKGDTYKVLRSGKVLHEGSLAEIRHQKSVVESIKMGVECGIRFQDASIRFSPGDKIISFKMEEAKQRTDWSPPGF